MTEAHADYNSSSSEPAMPADVHEMANVFARAIQAGRVGDSTSVAVFYDLSKLNLILARLRAAFPASALHAVAVKANPSIQILKRICTSGCGVEVASLGELHLALAAKFSGETIVFDSPVKTREELVRALTLGIGINANSLGELRKISGLYEKLNSRSQVGVRINPETGTGKIASTSVATKYSKFGVSLSDNRKALSQALNDYRWLTGVHVHIGSQGMSRDQLLDGVGAVYDYFIESGRNREISTFNVGGGLPAKYKTSETPMTFDEYADALRHRCPALFGSGVRLITEFGRAVHANCGWVAARIEDVVEQGGQTTLLVHIGADMFLRKAYRPDDWHHDISICDSNGQVRDGAPKPFNVAGPLCFAGDYLGRGVFLPENVREGDYVLVHDAGAYTFSMWSLYNSRQFPTIIGYEKQGENFSVLRTQQTVEEIVRFWS